MNISEPTIVLTDFLLGGFVLLWGILLLRHARNSSQYVHLVFAFAFFALALAAFAGGTFHGFVSSIPPLASSILWNITLSAISLISFLLVVGISFAAFLHPLRQFIALTAFVKLVFFVFLLISSGNFDYAVYDYGISLVFVLIVEIAKFSQTKKASLWILGAIFISLVAAYIQQSTLSVLFLDHNSIYHLVQIGAMYFFYRGGILLQDRTS